MMSSSGFETFLDSSKKRSIVHKLFACQSTKYPTLDNLNECPSFEELVQERKFDSICAILSDPATPSEWLAASSLCCSSAATPLHLLCQHQPTVAVVQKTLAILWTCDLQVDAKGRTPLHVAVMHGLPAAVVRTLLGDEFSTAAGVQDLRQRYPLHYAVLSCEPQQQRSGNSSSKKSASKKQQAAAAADNRVLTVQLLLEAYPHAVHEPDAQGRTPLDLARATAAFSSKKKTTDPRILASLEFAAKMLHYQQRNHNDNNDDICMEKPKLAFETSQADHSATTASSSTEIMDHHNHHPHPHDNDEHNDNNHLVFADRNSSDKDIMAQQQQQQEWPLWEGAPTIVLNGDDDDDDLSSVGSHGVSRHKQRSLFKYVRVDL